MNKFQRIVLDRASEYLHAKNYEESKHAKLLLFEAVANMEHNEARMRAVSDGLIIILPKKKERDE